MSSEKEINWAAHYLNRKYDSVKYLNPFIKIIDEKESEKCFKLKKIESFDEIINFPNLKIIYIPNIDHLYGINIGDIIEYLNSKKISLESISDKFSFSEQFTMKILDYKNREYLHNLKLGIKTYEELENYKGIIIRSYLNLRKDYMKFKDGLHIERALEQLFNFSVLSERPIHFYIEAYWSKPGYEPTKRRLQRDMKNHRKDLFIHVKFMKQITTKFSIDDTDYYREINNTDRSITLYVQEEKDFLTARESKYGRISINNF